MHVKVTGVCSTIVLPVSFDKGPTAMFGKIRSLKIIVTIRRTADRKEMRLPLYQISYLYRQNNKVVISRIRRDLAVSCDQ